MKKIVLNVNLFDEILLTGTKNKTVSIEPNENGQTVVYHKYGNPITFAVDTMEFLKLLYDSRLLNFYFEKEVDKIAPNLINQVKLTNIPRE